MQPSLNLSSKEIEIIHDFSGLEGDAIDSFEFEYKSTMQKLALGKISKPEATAEVAGSWMKHMETTYVSSNPEAAAFRKILGSKLFGGDKSYKSLVDVPMEKISSMGTLSDRAAGLITDLAAAPIFFPFAVYKAGVEKAAEFSVMSRRGLFNKVYSAAGKLDVASDAAKQQWRIVDGLLKELGGLNERLKDSRQRSGKDVQESFEAQAEALKIKKEIDLLALRIKDSLDVYRSKIEDVSNGVIGVSAAIDAARSRGLMASVSTNVFESIGRSADVAPWYLDKKFEGPLFENVSEDVMKGITKSASAKEGSVKSAVSELGNVRGALSAKAFVDLSNGLAFDINAKIEKFASGQIPEDAAKNSVSLFVAQMNDAMRAGLPVSGGVFDRSMKRQELSGDEKLILESAFDRLSDVQKAFRQYDGQKLMDPSFFYDQNKDGTNTFVNYKASVAKALRKGDEQMFEALKVLSNPESSHMSVMNALEDVSSLVRVDAVNPANIQKIIEQSGLNKGGFKTLMDMFPSSFTDGSNSGRHDDPAEKLKEKVSDTVRDVLNRLFGPQQAPSV